MTRARVALALGLFTLATVSVAQTTGDISGLVTDGAGEPLPGATVEATSTSLPGKRTAVSGLDGVYRIPAIPPGIYTISGSSPGFHTIIRTCSVSLGSSMTVDLVLQLETREKVVVSGKILMIDEGTTRTGTTYTSGVIAHLPVARNYADIVRANPGVSNDINGYTDGRFLTLSIYGATASENQWLIDGITTTNAMWGSQGTAINNEFVQEVEVMTGGYSAEYGRALGGVVNAVTKSGGNDFHGDGFGYYDSSETVAQKQFKPGDSGITAMRLVDGQQFDYGVDLGGFILKDRLWFFGAYNRVSLQSDLSRVEATPNVSTDELFPLDTASNYYSGKLTWNAASGTTLVGSVFADPSTKTGLTGADPVNSDPSTWWSALKLGGTNYGMRVNQLFGSRSLATLQGSYHEDQSALTPPPGIRYLDLTCSGGAPDNRCAPPPPGNPNDIYGGYGFVGGFLDSGSSRWQVAFSDSLDIGAHELKVGGDFMNGQAEAHRFRTGGQQVLIYNEYGQLYYEHRFYTLDPADPVLVPSWDSSARVLDYGAFLQDSWKPAPNVTVNVGLRWDGEETRDYAGKTVLKFNNQWQPRLGVVWDPWSNGETKVYASAGRFSYGLPTWAAMGAFGSQPYTVYTYNFDRVNTAQDPNVFGHGQLGPHGGGSPFGLPVDSNVQASYQDEFTVGLERLLFATMTVGVNGTYRSLNRALEDRCDFDYTDPQLNGSSCALINPGSGGTFASGNAGTCNGLFDYPDGCYPSGPPTPPSKRYYRGIEFLVRDTIGQRLWLQASYVYSSLFGNYDGPLGLDFAFDYPALWHNGYGDLGLDRPNHFRFDGYWVTPWKLTVGLQAFAESGAPLSKLGYFNGTYGASIFLTPRGSEGHLPTLWGANLTLGYSIPVGPTMVTLQAYLYNVFNKQIAISKDEQWTTSPPDGFPANIYDPNQPQNYPDYGLVTARSDPRLFRAAVKISF